MTRFELAASWSQTRRSSQTEPHPDVLQHHFYEVVVPCALKNFFSLAQGKSYYIIWSPICQHLFYKFLYFFSKKDVIPENPLKMRVFRPSTTCIFLFFDYFQKNISKNISFPQSNIQVFSVTNTEFQFPALPLYTAPSPHNLVCGLPVSEKKGFPD